MRDAQMILAGSALCGMGASGLPNTRLKGFFWDFKLSGPPETAPVAGSATAANCGSPQPMENRDHGSNHCRLDHPAG